MAASEIRTALVTGGNRGIGLEVCRQLAAKGLRVVLSARDPAAGRKAAAALAKEGLDVRSEELNVASETSVRACAQRLSRAGIRVDVLVNNAGVCPAGTLLDVPMETFQDAMEANLYGAVWTCRAFVPAMLTAGYGRVVNVSSGWGSFAEGLTGPAAYSISKAALNASTLVLSREVRGDVKVNAVCPGWVRTRMGGPSASRGVEKGAETVVWLATLGADGPNGGFFRDRKPTDW